MPKRRAGLHKEISSIFNGVPPVRKDNGAPQPAGAPAPEHSDYEGGPEHDKGHLGPPAPSNLTPTKPKPEQSSPKATPAKQTKAAAVVIAPSPAAWQKTLDKILDKIKDRLFALKPDVNATRQKTMAILVPVLSIILIFAFIHVLKTPSRGTNRPPIVKLSNAVAASNNKIDWQIPAPYPTTLRDPMQFGLTAGAQGRTGRLIVKGIVYSEDNPSVVIGAQIVHEGEKVFGATIVNINRDSVEFEMDGKRWTQKVHRN